MEVPQLVRERLGEESVEATVSLGDEDVVCVTPTRTFLYRGEGLLSDEAVSVYPHDVERFDVSEGRRKTKFVFEYVDDSDSFTVPGDRTGAVLKLLLGGILYVADVTVDGESISDVFSFSELTLVVTSHRLVKHVGATAWDDDFEEYPYADVTGLSFEEGSVATQVVLSVDGRPQRIKAPSEQARTVERTLTQALFAYHEVNSLEELNETLGTEDSEPSQGSGESLSLDDGISPLVGGDDDTDSTADGAPLEPREESTDREGAEAGDVGTGSVTGLGEDTGTHSAPAAASGESDRTDAGSHPSGEQESAAAGSEPSGDQESAAAGSEPSVEATVDTVSTGPAGGRTEPAVDPEEFEAMKDQLSTLTTAVKKQNQLLRDQQETIDQLVEELRRGR